MILLALLALSSVEGLQATAPQPAPEAKADDALLKPGSFKGSYLLPGTTVSVKVGGYLKLDVIHDFDAIGSEDSFDPRTIPTDGSEGENTQVHARQSRLNLDVRTPTELGPARLFLEVDFFSDQNGLRLRHAYATVGGLLAGQTWSTFMDEDAMPPTLDFEEPTAYAMIRVAQVRWTQTLSDDWYVAFGLEAPDSEIDENGMVPAPPAGEREDPYPDLASRLRWTHGAGHLQASAWLGFARWRSGSEEDDEVLWGFLLTGKLNLFEKDALRFQVGYGHGVARYRGGDVAAPDINGELEALPVWGVMGSYEHFWSDEWSTHVCYSVAIADNTDGQALGSIEVLHYAAANLVWRFLSWASAGVEYLFGAREDLSGDEGDAHRVMLSFKFMLP